MVEHGSPNPTAAAVETAAAEGHAAAAGHGDAHDAEPLGPLDPAAWGAGLLGVAIGLVTAAVFYAATVHVPG